MPKLICIDGRDHVCATTALSTYAKLASCHQAHLNMVYDSSSFHTFRHVFLLQGFTEPIIGKVGPRFPVPRVEIPRRPILSISRVSCITPKTSLPSDMFLPNSRSRSEPRSLGAWLGDADHVGPVPTQSATLALGVQCHWVSRQVTAHLQFQFPSRRATDCQ